MSKVKKYDPFGYDGLSAFMTECEHGDFVRHKDYAALEAERDALRQQLAEANRHADRWNKVACERRDEAEALRQQRDKLAGLLRQVMPDYVAPPGMGHIYVEAETALAEVE